MGIGGRDVYCREGGVETGVSRPGGPPPHWGRTPFPLCSVDGCRDPSVWVSLSVWCLALAWSLCYDGRLCVCVCVCVRVVRGGGAGEAGRLDVMGTPKGKPDRGPGLLRAVRGV